MEDFLENASPCRFCGSSNLVSMSWVTDQGDVPAIQCSDCFAGAPEISWNRTPEPKTFADNLTYGALMLVDGEMLGIAGPRMKTLEAFFYRHVDHGGKHAFDPGVVQRIRIDINPTLPPVKQRTFSPEFRGYLRQCASKNIH